MELQNKNTAQPSPEDQNDFPGYPLYPASEDIYNQFKKEDNIDPEDPSRLKDADSDDDLSGNQGEDDEDISGDEVKTDDELFDEEERTDEDVSNEYLDAPGSGPDDNHGGVRSEYEENKYYSLASEDYDIVSEREDLLVF